VIDATIQQLFQDGWISAGLRLAFIALIYLFLYQVLRITARELVSLAKSDERSSLRGGMSIVVLDGAQSSLVIGESRPVFPDMALGRDPGNDLVIDDPHTSAFHAVLLYSRDRWWLRDLDSSNGTFLNDEPVRAVVAIAPNDVLQCGRVRFRMVMSFAVPE
jgi:hypothetical protein